MGKEALVVERKILFQDKEFQGFLPFEEYNFISLILNNYKYHQRSEDLENNEELQQVIPYVWIINPSEKKIFVYKRSSGKENYNETRLMRKISAGVGGHIDREDSDNPIENAMIRELMEEVKIKEYPKPKIIGYLNDDSNSVGKVHFGIVAIAETNNEVSKGDNEMLEGKFQTIREFEDMLADSSYEIETWTRISWPFIKNYVERL